MKWNSKIIGVTVTYTVKKGFKVLTKYAQQNEFKFISINAHFPNPWAQIGYVDRTAQSKIHPFDLSLVLPNFSVWLCQGT